jgi:hypothetical protein
MVSPKSSRLRAGDPSALTGPGPTFRVTLPPPTEPPRGTRGRRSRGPNGRHPRAPRRRSSAPGNPETCIAAPTTATSPRSLDRTSADRLAMSSPSSADRPGEQLSGRATRAAPTAAAGARETGETASQSPEAGVRPAPRICCANDDNGKGPSPGGWPGSESGSIGNGSSAGSGSCDWSGITAGCGSSVRGPSPAVVPIGPFGETFTCPWQQPGRCQRRTTAGGQSSRPNARRSPHTRDPCQDHKQPLTTSDHASRTATSPASRSRQ